MTDEPRAYKAKLSDFKSDPRNLNRHTERGKQMVEASQRQRGYARPAFAAKDGTVLGGNLSTMEVAPEVGIGEGEVFVVESAGEIPIIHLRTDIEAGTEDAVLLAAEDNQSALVSIDFDPVLMAEEMAQGVDFSGVFSEGELDKLLSSENDYVDDPDSEWTGMPEFKQEDKTSFQAIHVHFKNAEEVKEFAQLIGQSLTDKTRSIWYSEREKMLDSQERYVA